LPTSPRRHGYAGQGVVPVRAADDVIATAARERCYPAAPDTVANVRSDERADQRPGLAIEEIDGARIDRTEVVERVGNDDAAGRERCDAGPEASTRIGIWIDEFVLR